MFSAIPNENNDHAIRAPIEHSMVMLTDLKEEEESAKIFTAAASTLMADSRPIRTHDKSMFPYSHPS